MILDMRQYANNLLASMAKAQTHEDAAVAKALQRIQCPHCNGTGIYVRPRDWQKPSEPCVWCAGRGTVTTEQVDIKA